jgi:hypothetical protein
MALVVFFLGVFLDRGFGAVIALWHDGIDSTTSQLERNKGSKTVGTQCCVYLETARYRAPRVLAVTVAMLIQPQPN